MIFREATIEDIPQILEIRMAVHENVLTDPNSISHEDCVDYLTIRGRGWVCIVDGVTAGFSIIDLQRNNVWALFVQPGFESRGVGRQLHDLMLSWYFGQTRKTLWLGTSPGTRAEAFYKRGGWIVTGTHGNEELKMEMSYAQWLQHST